METVPPHTRLGSLLQWCEEQGASDLHGRGGSPFLIRVHGRLRPVPVKLYPAPEDLTLTSWFLDAFSSALVTRIVTGQEVDASFHHGALRYRANFSKQRGTQSFSFRVVPQHRLSLEDLQLPVSLGDLVAEPRGLILVTGPTGQGKSTTLRALLQHLNESASLRIITVEDPIEYIFTDANSYFEQREVGIDTASFADGIRNAMRQDPNVIFIGEIRDRDSIWAAMQAAETGHLVLTTLHADSVPQAIGRIREFYPADEQEGISSLLARNLKAIVCQRLVPNVEGTRTPCLELMRHDAGVAGAILENDLNRLSGIIESANHVGMHSFDQYLQELLAAGVVTETTARAFAVNRHRLDLALRGIVTSQAILEPDRNR
ncbi:MAG TPA: PilT/PilU family type 4a pilus ATPase [Candidatus Limnocylindria bacterium]|nr:PilT/PilU family type 4a pilus ATPase [Candidatus Limnocylindria bacterium]